MTQTITYHSARLHLRSTPRLHLSMAALTARQKEIPCQRRQIQKPVRTTHHRHIAENLCRHIAYLHARYPRTLRLQPPSATHHRRHIHVRTALELPRKRIQRKRPTLGTTTPTHNGQQGKTTLQHRHRTRKRQQTTIKQHHHGNYHNT